MASSPQGHRGRPPAQGAAPDAPGGTPPRGSHRAQDRAREAWQWVDEAAKKLGANDQERYENLARKLPSYLQVSGLGQTFAFLFSKAKGGDKGPEGLLLRQLGTYVLTRQRGEERAIGTPDHIMSTLLELSAIQYRGATREAMAVAEWVKRFAAGRLQEK